MGKSKVEELQGFERESKMEFNKHQQQLTDSSSSSSMEKTDPPCISQLKLSSPPLLQVNMATDLLKSHRHSPIKGIAFLPFFFLLPLL